MKVIDVEPEFKPVTLLLESPKEVVLIARLLGALNAAKREVITGESYQEGTAYEALKQNLLAQNVSIDSGGIEVTVY